MTVVDHYFITFVYVYLLQLKFVPYQNYKIGLYAIFKKKKSNEAHDFHRVPFKLDLIIFT